MNTARTFARRAAWQRRIRRWHPSRQEQAERATRKLLRLIETRPFAAGVIEHHIDRLLDERDGAA